MNDWRVEMDNIGHEKLRASRTEFIKQARASCSKNLGAAGSRGRTYGNRNVGKNIVGTSETKINPLKLFLIRIVFAVGIFAAVFTISTMDKKYETNHSIKVHEWVTSNLTIEKAEDFFVSLLEKIDGRE